MQRTNRIDEDEGEQFSKLEAPAAEVEVPRPRMRLHHLFTLTAVMAAILSIYSPADWGVGNAESANWLSAATICYGFAYALLASVAITLVGYGIYWRRHGVRFFHEPGHWLLVEFAVTTLLSAVPHLTMRALGVPLTDAGIEMMSDYGMVFFIIGWLTILAIVPLNVYIGFKQCNERRWSMVFYLIALAGILHFGVVLDAVLVLLMLCWAVVGDRREAQPRDAIHWVGVVIQLLGYVLFIVWMFAFLGFAFDGWIFGGWM